MIARTTVLTLSVGLLLTVPFGMSGNAYANPQDEKAIQQAVKSYVEAFNKGDAKAVAAHFTQDGDYIDESGRQLKGRDAIAATFKKFFTDNRGLKLQITVTSLRFPAANLAVEDGTSVVIPGDKSPSLTSRYTAVYIKLGDQWKLSNVRESAAVAPTHQEHLEQLDWLIGEWVDEGEHGDVLQGSCAWSMNGNFIVRSFTSTLNGNHLGSGVQWIGWDPKNKQIRSWSFDSSGGFGQGRWTENGPRWVIESTSVLPGGETVTETDTVTRVDANTLTVQSTKRKVDGDPVPDSKKIEIKRVN